jgi:hypothetical protein
MQPTKSYQPLFARIHKPILSLVLLIIFLCAIFIGYYYFNVSRVEIIGIKDIKGIDEIVNKPIFLVNEKEIEDKLYTLNPEIETIKIAKKFPNIIQLNIVKNIDLIAIVVPDGYFVINKKARIISKTYENIINYPKMNYYQKLIFNQYAIGKYLKISAIENALFFYEKLKDLGIYPDTINIVDQDKISYVAKDKTYIFSIEKNNEKQFVELKIILDRFRIEKTNYNKIDLRFEKPIIGVE